MFLVVAAVVVWNFSMAFQRPTAATPAGQILPPRTVAKVCNVPSSFGTLKGVWEGWLVFEDADGTLRAVDSACDVRQTIRRE
jgi:hypothetical protein